ncbi:MAG: hypothetical protein ACJ711_15920, partial [Ornithinibacter sp.]
QLATVPAKSGTGAVNYADGTVVLGTTYVYRVAASNAGGTSAWSNTVTVTSVVPPVAPVILTGTSVRTGTTQTDTITWATVPTATGYTIQRSQNSTFAGGVTTVNVGAVNSYSATGLTRTVWYFRMAATNPAGSSANSAVRSVPVAP